METKKIAIACFIGGVLCTTVALMCSPSYWFLGLPAGFAGGYLGYEFKGVLSGILVAFGSAWGSVRKNKGTWWKEARVWVNEPHRFLLPAFLISAVMWSVVWSVVLPWSVFFDAPDSLFGQFALYLLLGFGSFLDVAGVLFLFIDLLATTGSRKWERCYFLPTCGTKSVIKTEIEGLQARGLQEEPITYSNELRWVTKGAILLLLVYPIKIPARGIWFVLKLSGMFVWHLFRLIHSHKRVLCGIDGTIGGAVSYTLLVSTSMPLAEQVLLVLFGGLFGAFIGIASWEIVSKRILHMQAESA